MKLTTIYLFLAVQCFATFNLNAQETIDFKKMRNEHTVTNPSHSELMSTPAQGSQKGSDVLDKKDWDVSYRYLGINHGSDILKVKRDSVKYHKTIQKLAGIDNSKEIVGTYGAAYDDSSNLVESVINPVVELDFKGNAHNGFVPPDNNIAVSNTGYIVSVVNSSIFFSDNNGNAVVNTQFSNFFSVLGLSGSYFDPKVIYDPVEDKFILVVLNGNTAFNSTVVVAFSETSDPNGFWWFYTFSGNPLNDGSWFDFPSIGISTDEIYISGNLFDSNDNFNQVVIYQIDKQAGFTGGSLAWVYWANVTDVYGIRDFTVVPISYGFDGTIGPGIFFVSSDSGGGNEVMLYWTTGTIASGPTLEVNNISVLPYDISGNGSQLGSSKLMKTNDTRIQSGFYANETIHFVMNTERPDLFNAIYYCRLNTETFETTTETFGLEDYEYAFPSVAPFTTSTTDPTVLIGFLRTGASIYPEFRVVTCDENWDWSSSVQVKGGNSYVDFLSGNEERWGDYSGIARRHSNNGVEVWVSGCYGEGFDNGYSNVLGTWIGKVSGGLSQQAPMANFSANQTEVVEGQQVDFTDLSSNNPSNWSWSFPGGTPNNSSLPNPVITYNTAGIYDVTLLASNSGGNDLEQKSGYIVVNPDVQIPIVNFEADETAIVEGQQVDFIDLSSNNPSNWSWSFSGGTPNNSTLQNPTITYNTAGVYDVALVASNSAGNGLEIKNGYVIVDPDVQAPTANFSADQTVIMEGQEVLFSDLSSNVPSNWVWSFPGGTPNISIVETPSVFYNTAGTYNVTLVASNSAGNDMETKNGYITVNPVIQTPQANFEADNTDIDVGGIVQFTDFSTNDPSNWVWSFPGGTPSTSTLKNPIIVYGSSGVYDVSLVASNQAGNNAITKQDYITVDFTNSIREDLSVINHFKIFPNPSTSFGRISAQFEMKEVMDLDFFIADSQGKIIKHLLHHRAKQGDNLISFNGEMLPSGTYYLIIRGDNQQILKNGKIIII